MKICFRVDSSIQIGTGHVMRCLTLADALSAKGAKCEFICREHPGHLFEKICSKGYTVHKLPMYYEDDTDLTHGKWLGATQLQDAYECNLILAEFRPDWLIVDHYGLDARWESSFSEFGCHVMVIDDLADRPHMCKLLLDQTFGRDAKDYLPLVPEDCTLLCGAAYALLRPEFAELRRYSLQRREKPKLKHLLITMGGVDKDNSTSQVLTALHVCPLPADCTITVVMGSTAPWLADVQQLAMSMPWPTKVLVDVNNMAQLMADSDLIIGAAGGTSWERCCMGLPCILVVLALNQIQIASALANAGAVFKLELCDLPGSLAEIPAVSGNEGSLTSMSHFASQMCDGEGVIVVTREMEKLCRENHLAM